MRPSGSGWWYTHSDEAQRLAAVSQYGAALVEAGWHVVGQVDTQSGQTIAEVEQW